MTNNKTKLSALEDAFKAAVKEDNLCPVGRLLSEQEADVRQFLEEKLNDRAHFSTALLIRVLKGLDFPTFSTRTMVAHRAGDCRCK